MKKLFITLAIAAAAAAGVRAQDGLSIGAGYQTYTQADNLLDTERSFGGFYVGADYTVFTFGPGISLTPGVYFSMNTYKKATSEGVQSRETYLGIPVNISYKFEIVPGTLAIAPYAGPTFSIGLSNASTLNKWEDKTDNFESDDLGRFNIGLGGGVALDIVDMIRVSVGYNAYLLNQYTGSSDNVKYTRKNAIHFGVAYLF